jgi:hypothetical protein
MAPTFLYLAWLRKVWREYVQAASPSILRGRAVDLSPCQFGAALLMGYLGEFSLGGLATLAGVDPATLTDWRKSPGFLLVMDWSKGRFAAHFQETLVLEDFSPRAYWELAGEFACLEESLRVRVRTRLYPQLKELGEELASRYRHGLPLETSSFPRFRRLFLFFWALEAFWPSPARPRLQEKLLPLAREVVWPALALAGAEELSGQDWHNPQVWQNLKAVLREEISRVFLEFYP